MFPELIEIGGFHLKTYGFCIAVGFIVCMHIFERLCGRKDLQNLLMMMLLSGIVGGRAAYVIEHWSSEFAAHPERILRVDQGGLMFYGGLILALVVFFVWCAKRKESPLALGDHLAVVLPLGHAFGRIGCFFYGCCYGKMSDCALGVAFPRFSPAWHEQLNAGLVKYSASSSLPVLPTQLFEAGALLLFSAVLYFIHSRWSSRARGFTTGVYLAGYAVLRFSLEYLRGDPRAEVAIFSIGQTISLGIFILGVSIALFAFGRRSAVGQ